MRLSTEVEIALEVAATEARRRHHEFITLEHMLAAMLFDEAAKALVRNSGGDAKGLEKRLARHLDDMEQLPEDDLQAPQPSSGLTRVIRRAAMHVTSSGKDEVQVHNVFVAMFAEPDSFAVSALEQAGVTRLDLVSYVSHGVPKGDDKKEDADGDGDAPSAKDPLKAYCVNLNEEAKAGRIDPLVGRSKEVQRMIQILARRKKNNPMLVGDAGVGKTAVVEGLAQRIEKGEVPKALEGSVIYSLDLGALVAGTRFRGDFEARLKGVMNALKEMPKAILFIDEIHTIVGAGATSGGSLDASNLLKPALAAGRIRCIGSTTFEEFRSHIEKDRAFSRRFQRVDVNEPSEEETRLILQGVRKYYEEFHEVTYDDDALDSAASLAARYMHDRRLPDKAVDLIDETGAATKLASGPGSRVTVRDVEEVLSRMASIPPREVKTEGKEQLRNLEKELKSVVFGQDAAIEQLAASFKLARAGLRAPEKPMGSFLLTGPTGVGKTEVAKQLARILNINFIRFDMSEYMERHTVSRLIGAPPGYVGFDQGGLLTDAVTKSPHSVLLLDEIEKAHPDVFNVLLQVMDHGRLTDNNGKSADFRHVVLLMTSNVGARDLARRSVGFGGGRDMAGADREFTRMFSPEFRNRLDGRISFESLSRSTMSSIVDKYVKELRSLLREKKAEIEVTDAARAVLAEKGYDPDFGARPLARVIQEEIKRPLAEELLFGKLEHGGKVVVDAKDGKIVFEYEQAKELVPA
ncbi:ATP-dependent Clp protease ATP-binding subunit ClpA [soil metagenome]